MKKKLILIIAIGTLIFGSLFSQTAYYDAIYLNNSKKNEVIILTKDIKELLQLYYPGKKLSDITSDFLSKNNPFFKSLFEDNAPAATDNSLYTANKISSFSYGLNVTNFADGVAKFMVERFKEELSIAFFEKFKEDLNKTEYEDLKILFPQTWKTFNTIDKDIYQFSMYINTLRESFIKDMTNQYINLQSLFRQQKYQDYFNRTQPVLGTILNSSLYLINQIAAGKHPGEVLNKFDTAIIRLKPRDRKLQINLQASIQTVKLISSSFRSKSNVNYWVPSDSVISLVEDTIAFKIYLGLLYQETKNNNISFSNNITLNSILNSLGKAHILDSIYVYKAFIETFISHAEEVNEYLTELKSKKKSEIDYNDYYKLFNSSLDLVEQTVSFVDLPYVHFRQSLKDSIKGISSKIVYVSRTASDLYIDVRTKNYPSAILNAVSILDTLMNYNMAFDKDSLTKQYAVIQDSLKLILRKEVNKSHKTRKNLVNNIENYSGKELEKITTDQILVNVNFKDKNQSGKSTLYRLITELIKTRSNILLSKQKKALRQSILRYGSFIAAVAQAQSSDDVKNAIESIALPAGSFSIKQKSAFSILINGYMGYAWDFNHGETYMRGIYAPIGVSFNLGFSKNLHKCQCGSFGLFASFIDIGGLAAYRLQNDTSTLTQEIKLQNIISPSVQIIYEFPKVPVTVCLGGRMTPNLFYSGNNVYVTNKAKLAFNASILVDIPFFTLKTWRR